MTSTPTPPGSSPPQRSPATRPISGNNPAQPSKADLERAMVLRDVMDHAVRVQREITAPSRLRARRVRMALLGLCVLLLAAAASYSWYARPALVWGATPALSPERRDANARVAMFLLAQRLDAHRDADGAYPKSLAQLGESASGMTYTLLADTMFELRSTANGRALVLRSTDRRDVFLGGSMGVISGRTR